MVKHLACGAEDRGSSPGLATMISEIGYLPLPSRDMTEITLKRRKTLNQPNPNPNVSASVSAIVFVDLVQKRVSLFTRLRVSAMARLHNAALLRCNMLVRLCVCSNTYYGGGAIA